MAFDFKKASSSQVNEEFRRIAKLSGDDQFFTRKELKHLPEIISEGESLLAFTSGMMGGNTWLIALTDRRVIFLDKGMIFGLKQTTIDLEKINSVTGETGLFFGKIRIQDGASERMIDNVNKKTVVNFTNKLRDAIELKKKPLHAPSAPVEDALSRLERLAALREKGVLTEAEFNDQKAIILGGK